MKSKKKLFEFLNYYYGKKTIDLESSIISNETYGNKSFIYIKVAMGSDRTTLKNRLIKEGFKVSPNYGPDSLEVQVSYFKGWHWNE